MSVGSADRTAFHAAYFAAAERMIALYRHARLTAVGSRSAIDARGQTESSSYEDRSLRSGALASLRHRTPHYELAYLSHPRRSLVARRTASDRTWQVEDESNRTPEQSRHCALHPIDILDAAGCWTVAPLFGLSQDLAGCFHREHTVTALERFTEERRFGTIPEEEFDPDRFLDGPQTTKTEPDPFTDKPSTLGRRFWLPFPIGALCLVTGAAIPLGTQRKKP